jgi:peptidoglycan/xylan/chitin deacetylase (PgdA/CDA1 family)
MRRAIMENTRYDYSPLIQRKPFKLPNEARLALWVGINIEYFDIGLTNFGGAGAMASAPPNVFDYAPRDYGNRIGIWRLMEVLDKYGIRGSVLLNSEVCTHYSIIIEEGKKRGWEFLGHGTTNSILLTGLGEAEEKEIITTTLDVIEKSVGQRPRGWLGPALQESFDTPDILAEHGVRYLCDWCCDDQPFPMKVKKGGLISVPYSLDLNDIPAFIGQKMSAQGFYEMIKDQFDTLYREGADQARVMCIALHPFLIGMPYRIGWLDKALQYITGHKDVWITTSGEIAGWYYEKYLGRKMV